MLRFAELLLVIGLIAAAFGFGGIAATPPGFARAVFIIYVVAIVVALLMGIFRRAPAVSQSDTTGGSHEPRLARRQLEAGPR